MDLVKIEILRTRLIDEYYARFYPNYSNIYQKDKQSILNNNRSPCTSLWRLFDNQIVPIEKFENPQVKVNLVIQEVKNGTLYCVINSRQISKNKFSEMFKDGSEMRRFRISLKNIKKIFSNKAIVYLRKHSLKGEKGKIENYYKNKAYF